MSFSAPEMNFNMPADWKEGGYLEISGNVVRTVSPGNIPLYIDFYKNGSPNISCTSVIATSSLEFGTGMSIQIPFLFKTLKIRLRSFADIAAGCEIQWIRFEFTDTGVRR
jgi:hypothetical protein